MTLFLNLLNRGPINVKREVLSISGSVGAGDHYFSFMYNGLVIPTLKSLGLSSM